MTNKILVMNSGSSSIKYQLVEMPSEKILVKGMVDAIGTDHSSFSLVNDKNKLKESLLFSNHEEGLKYIINSLLKYHVISDYCEIDGCGHRVAHGGENFNQSVLISDDVEREIDQLGILAPMHNPMNLLGYQILKDILPNAKHVAVFDTSFHQTISKDFYTYPISYHYYTEDHIRKYGFHGTSCKYITLKVNETLGYEASRRLIICHLGNGASITAVRDGKSIDTSMGLTPLGGIAMGTRCGNIDPSIIEYISQLKHKSVTEVLAELNYQSGLLGLSENSYDMRILCESMHTGNKKAKLAIDVYIKRIVDYIGSYYMHLGGLDTLVFTAGIGENSFEIRKMVVDRLKGAVNIDIDEDKNKKCSKEVENISSSHSTINVCVIKTNEEMMIAKDTYRLIC
ncbi:MAG: acetate kinase [Coprobacillus sp.]